MADEPVILGSKEWFQTVKKKLSEDEDMKKHTQNWNGALRCLIDCEDEKAVEQYTTKEGIEAVIGLTSLLSLEDRLKYKGTGLGNLIESLGIPLDVDLDTVNAAEVAEKASKLTVEDFKDVIIYASFDPSGGTIREMDPIAPDYLTDAPFTLSGKYTWWKELCSGKQSAVQLIMGGKMKLEGDLNYILKRMPAINALMKVYTSIPLQ